MDKQYKVSFCTTCKGRLSHLKETLPRNLENNAGYGNVEFVILDYGSEDGLGDWIKNNYRREIDAGKLRYAQVDPKDAPYFKMAHAKNMAHRLATGDILCNLDADNITAPGFAGWVNGQFNRDPAIYVRPQRMAQITGRIADTFKETAGRFAMKAHSVKGAVCENPPRILTDANRRGIAGRIVIKRDDFMRLRGYDERYQAWGNEDNNFVTRAEQAGLHCVGIPYEQMGNVLSITETRRERNSQHLSIGKQARKSLPADER